MLDTPLIAGISQAIATLLAGFFVIIAAGIQALGTDRSITANRELEKENLQRRYVGWLQIKLNDYNIHFHRNRTKAWALETWKNDPALRNISDVDKWIEGFSPSLPVVQEHELDLISLVPIELVQTLNEGNIASAEIIRLLANIRNRLIARDVLPHPDGKNWDEDTANRTETFG